jgi:hypothetical protein
VEDQHNKERMRVLLKAYDAEEAEAIMKLDDAFQHENAFESESGLEAISPASIRENGS